MMEDTASDDEVPQTIMFSSSQEEQQDMLPISEEAPQPSKIASKGTQDNELHLKPAPAALPTIGDDDYVLMPLRFDQPASSGMLDPIPLDILPGLAHLEKAPKMRSVGERSFSMPNIHFKSPFSMDDDHEDDGEDLASITSVPYNDKEVPANRFDGVPYHQKPRSAFSNHHSADLMSMGSSDDDDDHMISLCESIDCLSLDLDVA